MEYLFPFYNELLLDISDLSIIRKYCVDITNLYCNFCVGVFVHVMISNAYIAYVIVHTILKSPTPLATYLRIFSFNFSFSYFSFIFR